LSAVTETQGALLILPDGTLNPNGDLFWNATDGCCNYYDSEVDDVAYLGGLVEEAMEHFAVDPKRIYVLGHSNGGFMSSRLACERSDLFAGIVNFAGSTWFDPADCGKPASRPEGETEAAPIAPPEPIAVLHVHGDWDTTIPYGGVTPHEAQPGDQQVVVDTCLSSSCTETYDACMADSACLGYYGCLGACSADWDPWPCYEACWNAATDGTKALWMQAFTCGLGAGCYVTDPTFSWAGYPGAVEIAARWAERNGCDPTTTAGAALNLVSDLPGADTLPTLHDGCPDGQQVTLWTIEYGSHSPNFNGSWAPAIVNWLLDQEKP